MGNAPSDASRVPSLHKNEISFPDQAIGLAAVARAEECLPIGKHDFKKGDQSNSYSFIKGTIGITAKDEYGAYPLQILPNTSVKNVKAVLTAQRGIDMTQKDLLYQGKKMMDDTTLDDNGVSPGNSIVITYTKEEEGQHQRSSLYVASLEGSLDTVKACLAKGKESSNRCIQERTPLHAAAEGGHVEISRLLLRQGADVNAKDTEGLTPIHIAALYGQVDVFRLLFNGGANLNIKAKGMKVIHFAAIGGRVTLLEVLESICELTETTDSGLTPLHLAAQRGNTEAVLWLIEQGLNFNVQDKMSKKAEDHARENGHVEIAAYLSSWVFLQQKKFLHVIAKGNLVSIMSFFRAGIDVDCKSQVEEEWGHRAIHLASLCGHIDVIKSLLLVGARREAEDDMGNKAVHYAAAGGHIEVLELLKTEGCKLNVCNNLNMTPLHFAAICGNNKASIWLLEQGVLPNIRSNNGFSAADVAMKEGHNGVSAELQKYQNSQENQERCAKVNIKKKLGSGSFGTVYLAVLNDRAIVVKEINMKNRTTEEVERCASEVLILKKLKHPNIVTIMGCKIQKYSLNILMEYCGEGDLAQRIRKQKDEKEPFMEGLVVNWTWKISSAINYMHGQNFLHRDLKPANIFLSESGTIKVGDFGQAKILDENKQSTSSVGSSIYMSPEVLLQQKPYDEKCDMWSFGCILYELTSFQTDFRNFKVTKIPSRFSNEYKKLVASLLEKEPHKRPSSSEVARLPLFQTRLPKSEHLEMYQQQVTEAVMEIQRSTNNLMNIVLRLTGSNFMKN